MRSSSVTMRLPLVFESIQDLASINGTAEVHIRICRVLHRVSALLDLTLDEVRRGFEFSSDRPASNSRRVPHRRHESVFIAMNPTCLCLRKLLQSVCTTAALVSIAEMIQPPAQAQSPCHMLNTEPTARYRLGRVM